MIPVEDRIFVDELRRHLKLEIEIEELDCNLKDRPFAQALVESFEKTFREAHA